ncbi:MAG: aldehyde dehydrogenase family protein [Solirubrobacterales bacterium]|nr:aldehyde dehydrogenase family protein [Solirubrobacterales bacterium]
MTGQPEAMRFDIDWHRRAEQIELEGRAFIDGSHADAISGGQMETIKPRDGSVLARIAACDAADVDAAVSAARRSFESGQWSEAHPRVRKRVLHELVDRIQADREEIGLLISLEMGKPITDAIGEVDSSCRELAFFAEAVDKVYGNTVPTDAKSLGMSVREPKGVIGAVTPWNFPLMMPIYKVAPALAAGNSIVLKPAEQSSLAAIRLAELASEAGLPDGVLNVVPGTGEKAGRSLGLHMDVDAITFTGSTSIGKAFLAYSSESNMKGVWLECGGKSPNVVLADAPDLDRAAEFAAETIFHGAGQVCNAGSRLIVERPIYEDFVSRVARESLKWAPADPLDASAKMGPLVDRPALDRALGYVSAAKSDGATVVSGGGETLEATGGYFMEPTILGSVDNSMPVAQEEIFGPVLAAIELEERGEATRLANGSRYGLAAAIWTSDFGRAHRVARALKAGTVYINCYDRGDNSLPFGGFKESGIGVDRSLAAMEKYSNLKTIWADIS